MKKLSIQSSNLFYRLVVLSILYGNIAQDGAVIKVGGVDPSVKTFRGKAICCDSQAQALELIDNGTVKKGHVVVIRYEGPSG